MACVQVCNSSHHYRMRLILRISIFIISIFLLEIVTVTNIIIVNVTASSTTILNQQQQHEHNNILPVLSSISTRIIVTTRSTRSTLCINNNSNRIHNNNNKQKRSSFLLLFHYPTTNIYYLRQQQQQQQQLQQLQQQQRQLKQQHCNKSNKNNNNFLLTTTDFKHQRQSPITRTTSTCCQLLQQKQDQQELNATTGTSTSTASIMKNDLNVIIEQQQQQQQDDQQLTLLQLQKQQRGIGIAVLLTVPLAWGTYAPVIKYLYIINPPLPGFIFSSAYYIVAAITLWIVSLVQLVVVSQSSSSSSSQQQNQIQTVQIEQVIDNNNNNVNIQLTSSFAAATGPATLPDNDSVTDKLLLMDNDSKERISNIQSVESVSSSLSSSVSNTTINYSKTINGGIELGSYLFIGNLLQVIGLKTVPADRAGFLVQLTTIFVPLLQALYNQSLSSIPATTWLACCIAFIGVLILQSNTITIDSIADTIGSIPSTIVSLFSSTTGTTTTNAVDSLSVVTESTLNSSTTDNSNDILIVLAAIFYSFHVVRLGQYATKTNPLQLATAKATTEAILSTSLVILLLVFFPTTIPVNSVTGTTTNIDSTNVVQLVQQQLYEFSSEITKFIQSIASNELNSNDVLTFVGCVLWTGWVTCAYTIYAQSFGQRRVNSTDANLVYTIQPIFTSIFAYILVGDTLGPSGYIGGTFIAIALYIVATSKV